MRSVQARFEKIKNSNPGYSSYLCFANAIVHQNFSRETIHRWFNRLVEPSDYESTEKTQILAHLELLNKSVEDARNQVQIGTDSHENKKFGVNVMSSKRLSFRELKSRLFKGRMGSNNTFPKQRYETGKLNVEVREMQEN